MVLSGPINDLGGARAPGQGRLHLIAKNGPTARVPTHAVIILRFFAAIHLHLSTSEVLFGPTIALVFV